MTSMEPFITHGNSFWGAQGRWVVDVLPLPNSAAQLITLYKKLCLTVGVIVENGKIVSNSLWLTPVTGQLDWSLELSLHSFILGEDIKKQRCAPQRSLASWRLKGWRSAWVGGGASRGCCLAPGFLQTRLCTFHRSPPWLMGWNVCSSCWVLPRALCCLLYWLANMSAFLLSFPFVSKGHRQSAGHGKAVPGLIGEMKKKIQGSLGVHRATNSRGGP